MPLTSIVATLDAAWAVIADATQTRNRRIPRAAYWFPRMDLPRSTGYMPVAM